MALPADTQKVFDYLKSLLANGKEISLSLDEIKKKAKAPNIDNKTVSALIIREQKKGNFKNLTVKKFVGSTVTGTSVRDADYENNKKFRDFYNKIYKTPWNEIDQKTNLKDNSYKAFLKNKELVKGAKGFTLTAEEMAKKLGITLESLRTYEARPDENTSTRFVADNIEKKRTVGVNPTTGQRETVVRYKDPGVNVFKKWNALQSSPKISNKMVANIKEYDKKFRKELKDNKGKLPDIGEVINKTSMKTPTTIANTEALYSRLLRGETFRTDINIAKDAVLGKKIINELGINSTNNARKSAFYNLALKNVGELYPQKSGSLGDFKINFRNELRNILEKNKIIKKGAQVPFSVNEVISLSAGETRGIQPFSVFVDAVETNINKKELSNYQAQFSKKVRKIQELLAGKNPDKVEAKRIARNLDLNRTSLFNQLTEKGFTEAQIKQLNLPEIVVSKTIDPKHFTPEKLARWKEAGLDIPQFVKEKGFYIDVKKAKPFWESNVRNTIVEAAKNNVGNVCNIFKGKIAFSADGGRIGFQGGCGKEMTAAMEADAPGTLNEVRRTKGILPKFQNVAKNFLQSPLLKKGGKFGAIAAGGAAAAGLVKTFMNDDPSTYLSDENQQKNMLIDMITSPLDDTPQESPAILDWQLPVLGAETVAGTAVTAPSTIEAARSARFGKKPSGITKTALKSLGRGLMTTGTPLGLAALEPLHIAGQIQQGDSLTDVATNPWNYLGPAFMPSMTKAATKGLGAASNVAKVMRLGLPMAAVNAWNPIGWGLLAGSLGIEGYKQYQDYKNKRGWFSDE